jgi:hypothetical protein
MFKLKRRLTRFRDQEDGLVMTEFLILLPLLIWTFMALFVYWDAFRTINQSQKASFAVSDLLSRQSEVNSSFISGMKTVMQYLTGETDVRVRITSIQWLEPENEYYVLFSRSPGNQLAQLSKADVWNMRDSIPEMSDRDSVIIVETEVAYDPAFEVGIPNHTFDNLVVTRPRTPIRRVCLDVQPCPANM